MIHQSTAKLCLLAIVLLSALLPRFFVDSDALRAACTFACCLPIVIFSIARSIIQSNTVRTRWQSLPYLALFLFVAAYATLMGLKNGNEKYFLAADAFHWLVELVAVAVTFYLLLEDETSEGVQAILLWLCGIAGAAGIVGVGGAYAGVIHLGGYFQGGSRVWHLKAGLNYPEVLLIFLIAILWRGQFARRQRVLSLLTLIVLGTLMVLTLKRTMWISFLISLWFVLIRSRQVAYLSVLALAIATPFAIFQIVEGGTVFESFDFLTYNPNYSASDSINDRTHQIVGAIDYIRIFQGHGFGAEFRIRDPGSDQMEDLHYIHSLYILYALQFGAVVTGLLYAAWLRFQFRLAGCYSKLDEWHWLAIGALAANIAIQLNGITLVATNTIYAGMALGLGQLALSKSVTPKQLE